MKEKKFRFSNILYPIIIVGVISFLVYEWVTESNNKRERLAGIWLVDHQNKPYLITSSEDFGYKSGQYLVIRLMDPATGKVLYKRSLHQSSWSSSGPVCMTSTSLWVKKPNEYYCLEFPSLKKRWNQQQLFKFLAKKYPENGEPYNIQMLGIAFQVTSTAGKTSLVDIRDLEEKPINHDYFFLFDESNQVGNLTYYVTPETRFRQAEKVTIEIEDVDEKKKYHWEKMNLREKLLADTGYARNYAVFAPDSSCWFFDGNHSRTVQQLVNDSLELVWKPAFDKREWLEGDFLRPYKKYNEMPLSRLITTSNNIAFIHYWTSLDKKENKLKLAGVDLKTQKVLWDIDLTSVKIKTGCKPEQSMVFNNMLIIVWMDEVKAGTISGIEPNTGTVKWTVRK